MKIVEKKVKVKDKELKDLFARMSAAQNGMQVMAENMSGYSKRAWELATKLYGLDIDKKCYVFNPMTEMIEWKEFEEEKK